MKEKCAGEYTCECGKVYTNPQAFNGHKSHCEIHLSLTGRLSVRKHIDSTNGAKMSISLAKYYARKREVDLQRWLSEKHYCETCGKLLLSKYKSGRFCSLSCSMHRERPESVRSQIRESVSRFQSTSEEYWRTRVPTSSEAESKLRNQLISKYPDLGFKTGYFGKFEGRPIFPDIYSNVLKVIIEYDGEWHFGQIHGQLDKVQQRDRILVRYAAELGYKLIRIDEQFKYSFENLEYDIFSNEDRLILRGTRYNYLLAE